MRIRTAIRKIVKWGGAALVVVLLVVWVGSIWWSVWTPLVGVVDFSLERGGIVCWWYHGPEEDPGKWAWEAQIPGPQEWWFRSVHRHFFSFIIVPLWAPLLLTLIVTALAWRFDIIARRRAMLGKCTKCGYARAGLAAGAVCPECGTAPVAA